MLVCHRMGCCFKRQLNFWWGRCPGCLPSRVNTLEFFDTGPGVCLRLEVWRLLQMLRPDSDSGLSRTDTDRQTDTDRRTETETDGDRFLRDGRTDEQRRTRRRTDGQTDGRTQTAGPRRTDGRVRPSVRASVHLSPSVRPSVGHHDAEFPGVRERCCQWCTIS